MFDAKSSASAAKSVMAILPLRLLGLLLLTLAIAIPGCQAVFVADRAGSPEPFKPGFVRDR
jgi:hypothetical protein